MWFVDGFVNVAPFTSPHRSPRRSARGVLARLARDLSGSDRAADGQRRERGSDLAVHLKVGLNVLLHDERHVRVPDPLAQGLPVDLRIAASRRVAVPHLVQVDLR